MRLVEANLKKRGDSYLYEQHGTGSMKSYTSSNPNIVTQFNYDNIIRVIEKRFIGWDIPHFHRRRKRGELLPHTPWKQVHISGSGSGFYDVKSGTTSSWSRWFASNENYLAASAWRLTEVDLAAYVPDVSNKYVQEAAAAIYTNGFDALTFLAELADVRSLFLNTAKTLLKLKIPKNWKALSNEYLSVRYGWRTLFYDVTSLNKAIKALNDKCKRTRYSEVRGNTSSDSWQDVNLAYTTHYVYKVEKSYTTEVSLRGSVTADIEIPAFQFNPFQTAWEVVPFSFVLDWFLSVGRAISAASFLAFTSKYASSYGYKIKMTKTLNAEILSTADSFLAGTVWGKGQCDAEIEVRTPCGVPLTPHLTLKLNPWKVLDLLGLIIQRFR
jgi:hypothetical protein